MVRPERLLALHRQGRLLSSFHLLSHLWEASNITTRAISQFPRPVFHRQDTQHYGLQTKTQSEESLRRLSLRLCFLAQNSLRLRVFAVKAGYPCKWVSHGSLTSDP